MPDLVEIFMTAERNCHVQKIDFAFIVIFCDLHAFCRCADRHGRASDRAAIRAHIESIFQAFINKDGDKLRATHSEDWRGFLEGSAVAIRGIEEYMRAVAPD